MTRRVVVVAVAVLVAAALLIAIGRWERGRHADRQNHGIERVREAVGPLDSPTLKGFRFLAGFQCLVYSRGANELALELCVDRSGRVVEAIDRRSGEPDFWSLREDPTEASVRVDRGEVERLIVRMCANCEGVFERDEDRADQ